MEKKNKAVSASSAVKPAKKIMDGDRGRQLKLIGAYYNEVYEEASDIVDNGVYILEKTYEGLKLNNKSVNPSSKIKDRIYCKDTFIYTIDMDEKRRLLNYIECCYNEEFDDEIKKKIDNSMFVIGFVEKD